MTRFRAAGIHLAISALIIGTVLLTMLGLWYPGAYFKLMGGGPLLFILAGVDVCIGPLLTLIVFKAGKKELAFDLTAIAFVQVLALSYGVTTMFQARPVFTVYWMGMFQAVAAKDLDRTQLADAARPEWKRTSLSGPTVVAAGLPADPRTRADVVAHHPRRADLYYLPRLYVPYADARGETLRLAAPLSMLRSRNPASAQAVDEFLRARKATLEQFAYLPVQGRATILAAVVDAKTGDFRGILDVRL